MIRKATKNPDTVVTDSGFSREESDNLLFWQIFLKIGIKRDSPVGNHKRRAAHGRTCPSITCPRGGHPSPCQGEGTPVLSWLGGVDTLVLSWSERYPYLGVSPCLGLGYPPPGTGVLAQGYPLERTWDQWGTPFPQS